MYALRSISCHISLLITITLGIGQQWVSAQDYFVENQGQWHESFKYVSKSTHGYVIAEKHGWRIVGIDSEALTATHGHHDSDNHHESIIIDKHVKTNAHTSPTVVSDSVRLFSYTANFIDFDSTVEVEGITKQKQKLHYIYHDKQKGHSSYAPNSYLSVVYKDIYDGIDAQLRANGSITEYQFEIAAHSDPSKLKWTYDGADSIHIADGKLIIHAAWGEVTETEPFAYQNIEGISKKIPCSFQVDGNIISFDIGDEYAPAYPLTIDPKIIFSSFSGAFEDSRGNTACSDEAGSLYSVGVVFSPNAFRDSIVNGGYQKSFSDVVDLLIMKFKGDGQTLEYATYLGGSATELPQSTIVNSKNELYILGITSSTDFPMTTSAYDDVFNGGSQCYPFGANNYQIRTNKFLGAVARAFPFDNGTDLFIARISADGSDLLGSTYLGGSNNEGVIGGATDATKIANGEPLDLSYRKSIAPNYGDQIRSEIDLDKAGNVYIVSHTYSDDFPVASNAPQKQHGGNLDALVAKLDPALTQTIWSTYMGGERDETGVSLKIDDDNHVIFTGSTTSINITTISPFGNISRDKPSTTDGYIAKINSAGNAWETIRRLGTTDSDWAYFVDLDTLGNAYVLGTTKGSVVQSQVRGRYFQDKSGQFLSKYSNDLKTHFWLTSFGASAKDKNSIAPNIVPTAFLVSRLGKLYISGWGGDQNEDTVYVQDGYLATEYNKGTTRGLPIPDPDVAIQSKTDGSDFYYCVFESDAKDLEYATYLGADGLNEHVDGGTCRFDKCGFVYQAVCSCKSQGVNSSFPVSNNAYSTSHNAPIGCNSVAMKLDFSRLIAKFTLGDSIVCPSYRLKLFNESNGGEEAIWSIDGKTFDTWDSIAYTLNRPGVYPITLTVKEFSVCNYTDTYYDTIRVMAPQPKIIAPAFVCEGDTADIIFSHEDSLIINIIDRDNAFINRYDDTTFHVNIAKETTPTFKVYSAKGCLPSPDSTMSVSLSFIPKLTGIIKQADTILCPPYASKISITDSLAISGRWILDAKDTILGLSFDTTLSYREVPYRLGVQATDQYGCKTDTALAWRTVRAPKALSLHRNNCLYDLSNFVLDSIKNADTLHYSWDFDVDGKFDTTSSEKSMSHIFAKAGLQRFNIKLQDLQTGCTSILEESITIYPNPKLSITIDGKCSFGLLKLNAKFLADTSRKLVDIKVLGGNPVSPIWISADSLSQHFKLDKTDSVRIKYRMSDMRSCSSEIDTTLQLLAGIPIGIEGVQPICFHDSLSLTIQYDTSQHNPDEFQYDIDYNGTIDFAQKDMLWQPVRFGEIPLIAYAKSSSNACVGVSIDTVLVHPSPTGQVQQIGKCINDSIQLSTVEPDVDSYQANWIFGVDTIIGRNIIRKFDSASVHPYQLFIKSNQGCITSLSKNITILDTAKINATIQPICKNAIGNLQIDKLDTILIDYVLWDFSTPLNRFIATKKETQLPLQFSNAGDFDVPFTVFARNGCQSKDTLKTIVHELPEGQFLIDSGNCIGDSILASYRLQKFKSNNISTTEWMWDSSTTRQASHFDSLKWITPVPSNHSDVKILLTSNDGCSFTDSLIIPVNAVELTVLPTDSIFCMEEMLQIELVGGRLMRSITLNNKVSSAYKWEIPAKDTLIQLTAIDNNGCLGAAEKHIYISKVSTPEKGIVCLGDTIHIPLTVMPVHAQETMELNWSIASGTDFKSGNSAIWEATNRRNELIIYTKTKRSNRECSDIDTVRLSVEQRPYLTLRDTSMYFCWSERTPALTYEYTEPMDANANYYWQDIDEGRAQYRWFFEPGIYTLVGESSFGCINKDSLQIFEDCSPIFPEAFSPNGLGNVNNEVFLPLNPERLSEYKLTIYNRWGSPVFSSNDPHFGWDGKLNDEKLPQGMYNYEVRYSLGKNSDEIASKQGAVLLIR